MFDREKYVGLGEEIKYMHAKHHVEEGFTEQIIMEITGISRNGSSLCSVAPNTTNVPAVDTSTTISHFVYHSPWIMICSILIGVVGITNNMVVLFVMLNSPRLFQKTPNLMITNQSLLDLFAAGLLIGYSTITDSAVNDSIGGQLYCRLWLTGTLFWGFMYASNLNLVALTIERYLSVVHTLWHKVFFSRQKAMLVMGCLWFIGVLQAGCQGILTAAIRDGHCFVYSHWASKAAQQFDGVFIISVYFVMPVVVFVFCYIRIFHVIRARLRQTNPLPNQAVLSNLNKAKRNVIQTLALVCLLYTICWSSNQIYFFMINMGFTADFSSDFYNLSVLMAFANCMVNPIVYVLKYEQFRLALCLLCGKRCINRVEDSSTTTSNSINRPVTVVTGNI